MNKISIYKKSFVIILTVLFCITAIFPTIISTPLTTYSLPPPMFIDMPVEETIFRRMSVREFTEDPVTDEELSTILWAAYGYTDNGNRTVHGINGIHAGQIYVLMEDAVYKYDALNHSLIFHKDGDYRYIGQYEAPIQLGLIWDKDKSSDENLSCAELGEIGQNIHFVANALDMGTVVTAEIPSPLSVIDLPSNEEGKIVMPLGHPEFPYELVYRPLWLSLLPRIKVSSMPLTNALQNRSEATNWDEELTRQEETQAIWVSYGYSYLLDEGEATKNPVDRHRTVPSAHGYYPLRMYAVTESGISWYVPCIYDPIYGIMHGRWRFPIITFLLKIASGDKREEIAQASQSFVASAPLLIISVIDLRKTNRWDDLSGERFRWLWYYEAGASAHNILLEATAWNLSANITTITDASAIRSTLRLSENFVPLLVVPVGK
jgi:nitroreductase